MVDSEGQLVVKYQQRKEKAPTDRRKHMLGITFSAEAEPSAAERISDCFQYFESRMDVIRLPRYCKVLDSIKIILSLRRMKKSGSTSA